LSDSAQACFQYVTIRGSAFSFEEDGNDRISRKETFGSATADIFIAELRKIIIPMMFEIRSDLLGVQGGKVDWTITIGTFETRSPRNMFFASVIDFMCEDDYLSTIFHHFRTIHSSTSDVGDRY
jgi:hypothetical protein